MKTAPFIPQFDLYGEPVGPDRPAFVHIETIPDRSALHDWEIKPHRHSHFHQLLLLDRGVAETSIDGENRTIIGPALVIVPPGIVHGFRFDPGVDGQVLTLSTDFGHRIFGADDPLQDLLGASHVVAIAGTLQRKLAWLSAEMLLAQADVEHQRPALLLALAESLLRMVAPSARAARDAGNDDTRAARFHALVEQHYREQQPLVFYASALGVTLRTLSRFTQARHGCSPKEFLHRRLALEARRLILYTNASGVQVAAALGFDDPSYFSRFYLRMTGNRPRQDLEERQRALPRHIVAARTRSRTKAAA